MATLKQIESNRKNAQNSTGPRTETGKAVSRLNALKSGIDCNMDCIFEEERADLNALKDEYDREFQPRGVVERCLVDILISDQWRLRRYDMLQASLHSNTSQRAHEKRVGAELGGGFADYTDSFNRLHRHREDTKRSYFHHLEELERRQAVRRQHQEDVYTPVTDSPQTLNPEIGFVSQPDQPAPEPASEAAPIPAPRIPKIAPLTPSEAQAASKSPQNLEIVAPNQRK